MPGKRQLILLSLIACIALATPAMVFGAPAYKDGSYTATFSENGLGSLTVTIAVLDGAIVSIDFPAGTDDIDMPQDTLKEYVETLQDAPLVMEVDAISGATSSCNLLKSAIYEALLAAAKN